MKNLAITDTEIDTRNTNQIAKLGDWCKNNLTTAEWDYTVITLFPLRIKFRFHCPKTKLWAILNS